MRSMSNRQPGPRSGKHQCRFTHLLLCAALACSPLTLDAVAGVAETAAPNGERGSQEPAENTRPASSNRQPPPGLNRPDRNAASSVLKCWQKGELILHEIDWKPAPGFLNAAAGMSFVSKQKQHSKMHWLELGETFCVIRSM